ncbi:MAG TPA: nucleotidyltransferase domain-containing protein [Vicinamibacterales bacterium]|nr:nucleotidyltransferase domain-containing protein [Vicinamibacterales bacterium]
MRRAFDPPEASREEIARLLARELAGAGDVVFAYLHGSFPRGEKFHDIDVAVSLSRAERPVDRCLEPADRLTRLVRHPVDVRPLDQAPPAFLFHVFRESRLLTSRDDERLADLIETTARRYLDIAPLLRRAALDAHRP